MLPNVNQATLLPIIYVRGYAMSEGERNQTAADPFCGFNDGSTVYRASTDRSKNGNKFVFESPVLRLGSDFGYRDVYENGFDIIDSNWPAPDAGAGKRQLDRRSVIVFRYYDDGSTLLGDGTVAPITEFATGLGRLILLVRELVCARPENGLTPETYGCYLVAHSMGGLVCRTFLQNTRIGEAAEQAALAEARRCVDKVFTYATPHNGIDLAGFNVPKLPDWIPDADVGNFNRTKMASYLDIETLLAKTGRVDWLPEDQFPSSRFFCMVATNRADYDTARGLSRTFAGSGSDGLVRIDNASVWGVDATGKFSAPCATAYAYRSHSGAFGIVNSEESYQNLTRFLFGDLRVDIWVDITGVRLPAEVQKAARGKHVDALYQFEIKAAPRGKRWHLSRRVTEEDSVACRPHSRLANATVDTPEPIYLSSVFLASFGKVDPRRDTWAYCVQFRMAVPDYEIDRRLWLDTHFEGRALFSDELLIEIFPPAAMPAAAGAAADWAVRYDWQSSGSKPGKAARKANVEQTGDGRFRLQLDFADPNGKLVSGALRFDVTAWNGWRKA